MKKYALLSVTDKTGVVEFARNLQELGFEILSTGGTAKVLSQNNVKYTSVSEFTGQKEIMDGRVKTLHPMIHGGILARRNKDEDILALNDLKSGSIEVVAVNLYQFGKILKEQPNSPEDVMIEHIDIGGPTLLRAAAKNFAFVYSVIDPSDYNMVIKSLKASGHEALKFRRELSAKVFVHISNYDLKIASYLSRDEAGQSLPKYLGIVQEKIQDLRYGENPNQNAGWYAAIDRQDEVTSSLKQLQGKELSYNNLNDAYAASDLMIDLKTHFNVKHSVVIVKHANPCGVALSDSSHAAFLKALSCDPVSAFGGIIAFSHEVDKATAEELSKTFYEVIIAPSYDPLALEALSLKKNLRLILIDYARLENARTENLQFKTVIEGALVQGHDDKVKDFDEIVWAVGTEFESPAQEVDAKLATIVCKHVKSNAIVLAKNELAIGIGAGQMNRVDSSRISIIRARRFDFDVKGSVVASDAFLPFSDNIDEFSEAGVSLVVQPGGSIRDAEVIEVAKSKNIKMVFTGHRHFRH